MEPSLIDNLPSGWYLVEEWENNFIFENSEKSFCVNISYAGRIEPPFSIGFNQLKEAFTRIGLENGAYSTHAFTQKIALNRAISMMLFINERIISA